MVLHVVLSKVSNGQLGDVETSLLRGEVNRIVIPHFIIVSSVFGRDQGAENSWDIEINGS